jgi:hypothetical protein
VRVASCCSPVRVRHLYTLAIVGADRHELQRFGEVVMAVLVQARRCQRDAIGDIGGAHMVHSIRSEQAVKRRSLDARAITNAEAEQEKQHDTQDGLNRTYVLAISETP